MSEENGIEFVTTGETCAHCDCINEVTVNYREVVKVLKGETDANLALEYCNECKRRLPPCSMCVDAINDGIITENERDCINCPITKFWNAKYGVDPLGEEKMTEEKTTPPPRGGFLERNTVMDMFNAKHLVGLCKTRMIVDAPLETQLEIAFDLLLREGLICSPQPEVETPAIPTLREVFSVLQHIDDDPEEVATVVYNLATGKESISDYEKWKVTLFLYIDDNEVDRDECEFSQAELATGQIGFGDFAIDFPTSDIQCRVNDFLKESISSWNGEDDAKFRDTWCLECDFGCDHDILAEIEIERI